MSLMIWLSAVTVVTPLLFSIVYGFLLEPHGPPRLPWWKGGHSADGAISAPWKVYDAWSKIHGSIFPVYLPGLPPRRVIVVTSWTTLQTLFSLRSANYSTRPLWRMAKLAGRDNNVAFTPYNPRLKTARRLLRTSFGPQNQPEWQAVLEARVADCMVVLHGPKLASASMIIETLKQHVADTATYLTYGHSPDKDYLSNLEKIGQDTGRSIIPGLWIAEGIPWLSRLPTWLPGMGFKTWAKLASDRLEATFSEAMRRSISVQGQAGSTSCFVTQHADAIKDEDDRRLVQYTAGSVFSAATDTTFSLLFSAIHILSMNPDTLKKAYEEIDNLGRSPSMSDVERLPYITAIVMETHRIRPPVNFLSHAPLQDDTVDGLSIKQGSWVIGNIWSVGHDEELYPDPEEFRPERYSDSAILDPREFTFGLGRRRCPGEHVANAHTVLFLATLLHHFEIISKSPSADDKLQRMQYTSSFISHPQPKYFEAELACRQNRCDMRPRD